MWRLTLRSSISRPRRCHPKNRQHDPNCCFQQRLLFSSTNRSFLVSAGAKRENTHFGFVDTWSPGYLGFAASNHNGMLRMYEIFNQGGANTKRARMTGPSAAAGAAGPGAPAGANKGPTREWYRPLPASGEFDWSIRNSINYAETAALVALELTSKFPAMIVENIPMRWADGPILSIAGAPREGTEAAPSDADSGAIARGSVLVRFQGGDSSVLSGLMHGADQIRNRPAIIDAPVGKGRVIYFANNPIYRWQTFGEHQLLQRFAFLQRHAEPAAPAREVKSKA
jgi:hypothetical protein